MCHTRPSPFPGYKLWQTTGHSNLPVKVKNDPIKRVRWRTGSRGRVGFCWRRERRTHPRNRKGHGHSRATYWIRKWANQQVDWEEKAPSLFRKGDRAARPGHKCQGQCWERWGRGKRRRWDERRRLGEILLVTAQQLHLHALPHSCPQKHPTWAIS